MRHYFQRFFLLALLALCPLMSGAQSAVYARLDTNQISVGDPVRLQLEAAQYPDGGAIVWPRIPDSLGVIEVLERSPIDTVQRSGYITYRQDLSITGYDSGGFYVPSFRFGLEGPAGTSYLLTDSLPLLIRTLDVDTTKPVRPLKAVIEEPLRWYERPALVIGLVIAAALLLGALVFVLIRRFRKKAPPPPPPPSLPPHELALKQLADLEAAQLWQRGEVKEYYVRLSAVLRQYIHARFGLQAQERTSGELLRAMRADAVLSPYEKTLSGLLQTADAAKFARAQPDAAEHLAAMQAATDFVSSTKPVPPPEEEAASPVKGEQSS